MDRLLQDVLYGLRRLSRAPGFALVAIGTLALGIGANSAIFSIIDAVLLKPLPFHDSESLVQVAQVWEGKPAVYSPQNFLDVVAQAKSFESLAAIDTADVTLTGQGAPAHVPAAAVSAGFFDLLRVKPLHGRGFADGENEPGQSHVVVLGHRLWTHRFGADPEIVGRSVQIDRQPYLVVGVAPAGFSFPHDVELWTPVEYDPVFREKSRGAWYLNVIGRRAAGVSLERAREDVRTIAARLATQYPDANEGVGGTVIPLHKAIVGEVRNALLVLLGAVGLVLLIACVNVANLLLARVASREGELAVRTALGAGRGQLVRQLLTESVLLALLGGAAGLLLASLSLDALLALRPEGMARLAEVRIDRDVVAFATALSVFTGLLFGVFPALHMTRRATAQSLREGGRALLTGRGGRLRGGLVVGQMALAMVLLAGAGLLIKSFTRLIRVDPGFHVEKALTFRISLPPSAYAEEPRRTAFYEELLARLGALPGVRSTGGVWGLPLGGNKAYMSFAVEGRPPLPPAQQPSMQMQIATADYFRTMEIPVTRGRGFEPGDRAGAPQVVLLSETAVRRFFAGEDPIGKRIKVGWRRPDGQPEAGGEVVGIVGDVKEMTLAGETQPEIYIPYPQLPMESMDVVLRSAVPPSSLMSLAQAVVRELDPELPVARLRTLDDVVSRSLSEPRFYTLLLGAFASVALLLAALGIFGVMSYAVVQRSREIGIRVALGALPGHVLGAVLRQALVLAGSGVMIGLGGALALSQALAGLLFDVSPTDPATLGGMAILLTTVALLASYLPARQATRVDPVVALRSE
jgi:putative ABC transport system permease protein